MALTALSPLGDVLNDEGRVDVKRLAREIDVSIPTLALALGRSARWVSENPTARSIQPQALELIDALNALTVSLGGKKYVRGIPEERTPQVDRMSAFVKLLLRRIRPDRIPIILTPPQRSQWSYNA